MNTSNLQSSIKRLQDTGRLRAIKAEFESEGAMLNELYILSDICRENNISLTLKIGGPMARKDIRESFLLGANTILAPMIESDYAASLFLDIVHQEEKYSLYKKENTSYFINIETQNAVRNLKQILVASTKFVPTIQCIVIGRSDLSRSLGIKDVESNKLLSICKDAVKVSIGYPIEIILGGSISSRSYSFVNALSKIGLIAFESRKCTFEINKNLDSREFNALMSKAIQFEIEWLKLRSNLYVERSNMDISRIHTLQSRLNN